MPLSSEQKRVCKEALRRYPEMVKQLKAFAEKREDILTALPPGIVQRAPGKRGGSRPDRTATKALKLLELPGELSKAERYVEAIGDLMRTLNPEHKAIVRQKFFRGQSIVRIARQRRLCEKTIARRVGEVLERLALRLGL